MTTASLAAHLAGFPAWITEINRVYLAAHSGDTDATRDAVHMALANPRVARTPVGMAMRDWQRADRASRRQAA